MAEATTTAVDPLAGLIDIPLPPLVSLWPQTWIARTAIALVIASLIIWIFWFLHQRRVNRYRREALAELDQTRSLPADQLLVSLALLVRRTALAAFPRERVAALTDDAWLAFLDHSYGGREFSEGVGRNLEIAAYRPGHSDDNGSALTDLVRRWIKVHHA